MADPIGEWISRFEELEPADGQLTEEIIATVGPPPLPDRSGATTPEEARKIIMMRAGDLAGLQARVTTRVSYRCDQFAAEAIKQEESGDLAKAAQLEARINYWQSVARWVEQL